MDRISNLPLILLETILCLLPYQDVVRTSTLSKEWRYHWTQITKVMAIEDCTQTLNRQQTKINISKLLCGVGQALLMHTGPIQEFTLSVDTNAWGNDREIDFIMSQLSKKKTVKKLIVDFDPASDSRGYELPLSLFSMTQLTALFLNGCGLGHVPKFSRLKRRRKRQTSWLPKKKKKPNKTSSGLDSLGSLARLYVTNSEISMKSLLHILSKCPLLKTLTLKAHRFYDLDGITVTDLFESLKVIENLTIWRQIVEELAVNTNDRRTPQHVPVTLVHLKSLFIEDVLLDISDIRIIWLFIRSSPNLEKLTVNIMTDSRAEDVPCSRVMEVYSDIRLEHLRELEIINLSSTEIELYVVKFILLRSPVLKMLRIHITDGYNKVKEMHISETLLSAPRASPVVEFIVENEPPLTALSYSPSSFAQTSINFLGLARSDSLGY